MADDFFSAMGKAISNQWDRSVKELQQDFGADLRRVVDKTENEGFLQGAFEAADVFSPGNLTAEVLDGFNIIPEDPGLKELVSGGVNLGVGLAVGAAGGPVGFAVQGAGMLLAGKDLMEAVGACTTPNAGAIAQRPTAAQTPRSPQDAKRAAVAAAKEAAIARVEDKVALAEARRRLDHAVPASGGYCDCGSVADGSRTSIAELMKRLRELYGEDKTGKADAEIDKLLNNKSLCFEDLIFLLMRTVIKQGQTEVRALADELRGVGEKNRGDRKEMNGEIAELHRQYAATKDPAAREQLGNQIRELEDKRELTVEERMESRAEKAEELKNALQKLSEMQQALSNVLNTQHETAMGAIRNIR
ncbi:MAG: hypothetical protein HYS27_13735 [Deltaproteobacteria bacterium]|nr:hypothetical protein [Deltaproteobacteria bacterium]